MAYPTTIPEKFRVISRPETPDGWTVCEYRGATVRCSGVNNVLEWPAHPYSGNSFGQSSFVLSLIDLWLDGERLPRGYGVAAKKAL